MPLKEQIMEAARHSRSKTLSITAWGVPAFIRMMSGTERDNWQKATYQEGKIIWEHYQARLLVKTIADEKGGRVFTEADMEELSEMDAVELARVYDIAAKFNRLTKEDVDDLTKKS